MCQKLDNIARELSLHDGNEVSIVFGGDFNAGPDHLSVKVMKKGTLDGGEIENYKTLSYTGLIKDYLSKYLEPPLNLSSSYFDVMDTEPEVTSAVATFNGCLDYIFYTIDCLKVSAVVEIGSVVCQKFIHGGPSKEFASDHLPLIAEFLYTK